MMTRYVSGAYSDAIDALYRDCLVTGSPGGAVAVLAGGELVHLAAYGLANIPFAAEWTDETRYPIASITKTFVADLIIRLAERGVFSIDDPAVQHLPGSELNPAIRIRHLLTMTSGLPHDEEAAALLGCGDNCTNAGLVDLARRLAPLHPPGAFQIYCCSNYRLLARIVEHRLGMTLEQALREIIFAPLEMHASSAPADWSRAEAQRASAYARGSDGVFVHRHVSGETSGDGAIVSSIRDLIKYVRNLTTQNKDGHRRIARLAEHMPALRLPARYGHGLVIDDWHGRATWGHGGITNTRFLYLPDADVAILCLHNHQDKSAESTAYAIAQILSPVADAPERNSATLATLVPWFGHYASADTGHVIEVTACDGRAAVRLFGDKPTLLAAHGDGIFEGVSRISPFRITLEHDPHGRLLRLDEIGDAILCRPISAEMAATPDAYTGIYLSTAGGTAEISNADGSLHLRLGAGAEPQQKMILAPAAADLFHCDGTSARFRRGEDGRIDMLLLSRQRMRDLAFFRLPDDVARR